MVYEPTHENIAQSDSFSDIYRLAEIPQQEASVVKEVAENERPPWAADRASVKENCQGWCVRVISRLAERKMVSNGKLEMARAMMEPV